jgi:hypothetical protein
LRTQAVVGLEPGVDHHRVEGAQAVPQIELSLATLVGMAVFLVPEAHEQIDVAVEVDVGEGLGTGRPGGLLQGRGIGGGRHREVPLPIPQQDLAVVARVGLGVVAIVIGAGEHVEVSVVVHVGHRCALGVSVLGR